MKVRVQFGGVLFLAMLLVATTIHIVGATPQAAQRSTDPMTALLAEVRELRIAMQQNAMLAPRIQLTLARLNIEEQRIAQLASQLDQVRLELNAASLETQKLSDQVAEVDKVLQTTTDEKVRKSYEYEQIVLKQKLAAQGRVEQQLRSRENDAAQALSTEQARWIDLNARLDALEQLLGPIPR